MRSVEMIGVLGSKPIMKANPAMLNQLLKKLIGEG